MRVLKLVMCFAFVVLSFSCDKDDDDLEKDKLVAVWSLKSVINQGLDIPASVGELSQAITFNTDFTGSDYFPENGVNDTCDFETLEFSQSRDGNQLTINSVREASFLVQIILLTDTQLQISILENNDIPTPNVEMGIFKYEK